MLKAKIAQLIRHGWIKLRKEDLPPNDNANLLLNNEDGGNIGVYMLEVNERQAIFYVDDVKTLIKRDF